MILIHFNVFLSALRLLADPWSLVRAHPVPGYRYELTYFLWIGVEWNGNIRYEDHTKIHMKQTLV